MLRSLTTRFLLLAALSALAPPLARAQSIQPVITEYTVKAEGKFQVTNDTLTPMAIVLEPRSFNIGPDGKGTFRALDPAIHLELSTTSFRLEPKQSYLVFYKAHADNLPAWFTVYAGFSPINSQPGVKVRIMLPHTIYLYQKENLPREAIQVSEIHYSADKKSVDCDIQNQSRDLVRVQEVRAVSGRNSVTTAGFPLLPGSTRHLAIAWTEASEPAYVLLHFPHFDVKQSIVATEPTTAPSVP